MTTNQLKLRRMLMVWYGLAKKHYHGHTLTLIVMVNAGYGKENLESVIIVRLQLLAWYGENVSYNVYTYLYPSDTVVDKYQLCA